MAKTLLTRANAKIIKSKRRRIITSGLHLAPSNLSGYNTCASASAGCIIGCLNKAGHGGMFKKGETTNRVQEARIEKTLHFFRHRITFMGKLIKEVENAVKYARKRRVRPVFRLNLTSDIRWEHIDFVHKGKYYPNIMTLFRRVQWYDYTKHNNRHDLPSNYHLTFSRSENNHDAAMEWLRNGGNVAVVFRVKKGQPLPKMWNGYEVIDGDVDDLRFLDKKNVIVGLRAKGPAMKDTSGFVVEP